MTLRYGLTAQAKILGFQDSAQNPVDWPTSPALGIEQLLKRMKLTKEDISLWEINEAFAMVVIANANILGIDLVIPCCYIINTDKVCKGKTIKENIKLYLNKDFADLNSNSQPH